MRDIPHGEPPKKRLKKVEKPKMEFHTSNNCSDPKIGDNWNAILQGRAHVSNNLNFPGALLLPTVESQISKDDEEWVGQSEALERMGVEEVAATGGSDGGAEERVNPDPSTFAMSSDGREGAVGSNNSLESDLNFEQIFTTLDDDSTSDEEVFQWM